MPPAPEGRPPRPAQPDSGQVALEGGHQVTITRESEHQDALAGIEGPVVVELAPCTIDVGRYRGRRGIEVRLATRRVGELTYTMSQRYTALVEMVLEQGRAPTCRATVTREPGEGGNARVVLLLPDPDELLPPIEPATELLATQVVASFGSEPAEPPTALLPNHRAANTTDAYGGESTSYDSPFAGYPGRGSPRNWNRPQWIVAGAAAAVVIVVSVIMLSSGSDGAAPIVLATPSAEPTAAATGSDAATPTSAGHAGATARTTARRTTATPPPITPTLVTTTTPVPPTTTPATTTNPQSTTTTTSTTTRQGTAGQQVPGGAG